MIIRQLFDLETSTFTYLIAKNRGGQALLIDPVDKHIEKYIKLLQELDLTLQYVYDTHVHADHITASGKLRELTNCITILGDKTNNTCVSHVVKDNDVFTIDGIKFTVLETPGHTQDSYCLYTDGYVFTGDTLFVRGTGRTDFQAGDARLQYRSIKEKLFTLPEETIVYPGHDYNGNTSSTIYEEKRFNPRLTNKTEDEFVEIMNNLNLANPKMIDIAVPANLNCGKK